MHYAQLNPVAPKAQRKVPVPEGLDLEAWIFEPLPEEKPVEESSDEEDSARDILGVGRMDSPKDRDKKKKKSKKDKGKDKDRDDKDQTKEKKSRRHAGELFYIDGDVESKSGKSEERETPAAREEDLMEDIPVVQLSGMELGVSDALVVEKKGKKSKKSKKEAKPTVEYTIETKFDAPEGYDASDSEDEKRKKKGMHALSSFSLWMIVCGHAGFICRHVS